MHRGQNADHRQIGVEFLRGMAARLPAGLQFRLESGQRIPRQSGGVNIEFHIKGGQLGRYQRTVQSFKKDLVDGRRLHVLVHQPGLQLKAGHGRVVIEAVLGKIAGKQRSLFAKALHKGIEIRLLEVAVFNFLAHAAIKACFCE